MKKRLIIFNVILTVVVLAITLWLGTAVTSTNYKQITEKKIKEITDIYVANYSADMRLPTTESNIRVTIIDPAGKVIADSTQTDLNLLDKHFDREEIESARAGSPKVVVRKSDTLGIEMMYYAKKVDTENSFVYIRVAVPMESVNTYTTKSIMPMIFILLGVWLVSTIASIMLSSVLLKPLKQVKDGLTTIENGTYKSVPPTTDDADINEILSAINTLSEKLQNSIQTAKFEKLKLDYVLSNISDGIIVFNENFIIEIANRSACNIFGVTDATKKRIEVLTASESFLTPLKECVENKCDNIFQFEKFDRWYLCTARPTDSGIVIVVMCDITQSKLNEQMRLEFFANASHELKTPLTTIKGFNDLIALKGKDEQVLDYSSHIARETDRVLNLLADMLNLSKLDNSTYSYENLVNINLYDIASEVVKDLEILRSSKNIKITLTGSGYIKAEREHAYELIKNLTENALRYNNDGGSVNISIASLGNKTTLEVSDNGIGIGEEHQQRIFERFYRVNKSRSRASGGTGLGLAIVKHICEIYGAELTLKSKLDVGTTISISFSNN